MDDIALTRVPPHDLLAEQSVLGASLISRDALSDLAITVKTRDFYRPAHATIWEAITRLHAAQDPVDAVTVMRRLSDSGDLDRAGGAAYIHTLISTVPTAANAGYYSRIIRSKAVARALIEVGTRITQIGFQGGDVGDPQVLVDAAAAELQAVSVDAPGGTDDLGDALEEAIQLIEGRPPAAPTGIPCLDGLFGGWVPRTLTILAARPGVGKTAVALQSALHAAVIQGKAVGFTSLEMSRHEVIWRALSHVSGVDYGAIQRADRHPLQEWQWERISWAHGLLAQSKLRITDTSSMTVHDIIRSMRSFERDTGRAADLWFVDYLQLITSQNRHANENERIAEITRALKVYANGTGIPITLLSQLNRGAADGSGPKAHQLRGSGAIEQDADRVVLLDREGRVDENRPEVDPNDMTIDVAKNRQGQQGVLHLRWDGAHQCVFDPNDEHGSNPYRLLWVECEASRGVRRGAPTRDLGRTA